jgi:hypothetical protein
MIAYHILCHANLDQVARQIEALYSPEDVFLIDIDDGKPVDTKPLKKWAKKPNVHVKCDSNIAWGGAGTLRKTMNGAFSLLDLDSDWSYYVVLSGQCLPIKSNLHIKERLTELGKTQTNCIRSYEHPPVNIDDLPVLNRSSEVIPWGDRGHTKLFVLPTTIDPQCMMAARWRAEIVELGHLSKVFLRPVNELLMRRREEFFSEYTFCAGANWFNLHRSLLEYMREDRFTFELYEVLSTTLIPDESFFQTYIQNSPFRDKIDMDHTRLIARPEAHLGVRAFCMDDWRQISNSNALFARKFDAKAHKDVVDRVLSSCLNEEGYKKIA